MRKRLCVLFALALPAVAGDWNPKLAAEYLDSRQKAWLEWKQAQGPGGVCISCHTNMTYLMARPALRTALGEKSPSDYETALRTALRHRADKREAKDISASFTKEPFAAQAVGVEAVLAALFIPDEGGKVFDRLWAVQVRDGESRGSIPWFSLKLDPWEMPESRYYGSALAALAASRAQAERRIGYPALVEYLRREYRNQPLHNRLLMLAPELSVLSADQRRELVDELMGMQSADGGWTLKSLGPWAEHAAAPASEGSSPYATALAMIAAMQGDVPRKDARLVRAAEWLKARQNRETGAWPGESMNKKFEPGSMQILFMQDAATAFASLALLGQAP